MAALGGSDDVVAEVSIGTLEPAVSLDRGYLENSGAATALIRACILDAAIVKQFKHSPLYYTLNQCPHLPPLLSKSHVLNVR